MKRIIWALLTVIAVNTFSAINPALSQPVSNVSGFDAGILIGKVCIGTFSTKTPPDYTVPTSLGALRITFVAQGNMLTARQERAFGKEAFLEPSAAKWESVGTWKSLAISGSDFHAFTAQGVKIDGRIDGTKFSGIIDPRPVQPSWIPARLEFGCQ